MGVFAAGSEGGEAGPARQTAREGSVDAFALASRADLCLIQQASSLAYSSSPPLTSPPLTSSRPPSPAAKLSNHFSLPSSTTPSIFLLPSRNHFRPSLKSTPTSSGSITRSSFHSRRRNSLRFRPLPLCRPRSSNRFQDVPSGSSSRPLRRQTSVAPSSGSGKRGSEIGRGYRRSRRRRSA